MPIIHNERKDQILDIAQTLVQTRGYNGFSFGNLAEAIGVKTAAIHYHFKKKTDLGLALMQRYRSRLHASLVNIDEANIGPRKKLERYINLFHTTLKPDHRMCMCGMLATEMDTLDEQLRVQVQSFFEDNEAWLIKVLKDGKKTKVFNFSGTPAANARVIYSCLQGAMITSRTFHDAGRLSATGRWILDSLTPHEMSNPLLPE